MISSWFPMEGAAFCSPSTLCLLSCVRDSASTRQTVHSWQDEEIKATGLEVQHSLESQRSSGLRGHASKKPKVPPQPCLLQVHFGCTRGQCECLAPMMGCLATLLHRVCA